jgi:hypothetical protein
MLWWCFHGRLEKTRRFIFDAWFLWFPFSMHHHASIILDMPAYSKQEIHENLDRVGTDQRSETTHNCRTDLARIATADPWGWRHRHKSFCFHANIETTCFLSID